MENEEVPVASPTNGVEHSSHVTMVTDTHGHVTDEQYVIKGRITDEQDVTHAYVTDEQDVAHARVTDEQYVTHARVTDEQVVTDEQDVTDGVAVDEGVTVAEHVMGAEHVTVGHVMDESVTKGSVTDEYFTDGRLSDSLRNSAVARLLMEGRMAGKPEVKSRSSPDVGGGPPVDLSTKSTRSTPETSPPPPQVVIENVDPDRDVFSMPVNQNDRDALPAEMSPPVSSSSSSGKPGPRKRRKKQAVVSTEGGDYHCPYCPFQATDKTTMGSHFQFHQQILGSQSLSSRRSHLEWIQAYQAGQPGSTDPGLATPTPPPQGSPAPGVSSVPGGSPTLRSLLVSGADQRQQQQQSASGFLRTIVQNMMTQQPSSMLPSSTSGNKVKQATPPSAASSHSVLASVLSGRTPSVLSGTPASYGEPVPTTDTVQVKSEPIDYEYERVHTPSMMMAPTSTTSGTSPTSMLPIKEEPMDELPIDPRDPEWNPDSHSSGSSPLSGHGQPVNDPPAPRNSRKGNPKKRILGNFLQMREEELGVSRPNPKTDAPQLMLSLLQGGKKDRPPPRRAARKVTASSKQVAQDPSAGVRVVYVDKNDGKTFTDRSVQCELLVDDMATDLRVGKESYGYTSTHEAVVVGEAQEGQMGGHLHSIKCTHCNITFDDEVMHSIHMGCHSHKDPFICNVCGKHCSHKYEFYTHIVRGHQVDDNC